MFDKRYIETFLAGKPSEYRTDFERYVPYMDFSSIELLNKWMRPKFGEKIVGIIVEKSKSLVFGVKSNCFFTKTIRTDDYIKIRRDSQLSRLLD